MIQYDLYSLLRFQIFRNEMAMNMYPHVVKYYSKYINKEDIPVTQLSPSVLLFKPGRMRTKMKPHMYAKFSRLIEVLPLEKYYTYTQFQRLLKARTSIRNPTILQSVIFWGVRTNIFAKFPSKFKMLCW